MSENEKEILDTGLTLEVARRRYPEKERPIDDTRALITSSFFIEGEDLDLEACTRELGLQPTRVVSAAIKGRWLPSGKANVVKPQWVVERKDQPSDDVNDELMKLLDLLWPRREAVIGWLKRTGHDAGFTTSVNIFNDRPLYCLSPKTLKRLAYFNVEWGLDIFDYSD